ncbi:hypothetical protein PVAND_002514 [Polypedilum vanderplanki]|uniref:Cytochrome P450 n=1 Tax=Polypedilum vanderplanki TaxID=319348 RepID=A0A9J6BSS9_POLVA|nr:hypothetical protein PVAND_002514 [Polypedilum vanderplanki]
MLEKMIHGLDNSFIMRFYERLFMYFSPVSLAIFLMTISWLINYRRKRARMVNLISIIPGPPALPLIGNAIEVNVEHDEIFSRITGIRKLFGRRQGISKGWFFGTPYVLISKSECVEPILSNPKHIDKSFEYDFLHPWLGTGLLTSHGQKWFTRRKILTPAFHFKILEDFMDIFNEQSAILVKKLEKEIDCDSFNIFSYVTLCTLDIVCETAMGQHVNAQGNKDSDYVKAVYEIGSIILNRQAKAWLQPDFIFKLTNYYKKHQECIKILHGFSYGVIRERRKQINQKSSDNNNNTKNDENGNQIEDDFGKKKRLAFLDLLITASENGSLLSDEDIREEVDTFMFEGQDTTASAVSWCLFLLGGNPKIQDRVFQEIDTIMGGDRERAPTMKELNEMKYLECCIKEALRLYPSVPIIARHLKEDVKIDEYIVPAGTSAMIITYMLHRDPNIYQHPERYNPDRFLPENCIGRHPYSYIPFSAGMRNCIGQKFAILEEKAIISSVLRKYQIEAVDRRENLTLLGELILRPKDGLAIKITKRI